MFRRNQNNRIANKILENVPANHFTPRHYHVDLLDAVLERNSIICSSKKSITSYIALSLVKYSIPKNSNKILYLTSTDPDSEIADYFHRHTGFNCATYTAADTREWTREQWSHQISTQRVMVMSSSLLIQCLLVPRDDNEKALLSLSDIHILIVTDCHTALHTDSPLHAVMKHYRPLSQSGLAPHLLAISSELLHTDNQDPIQVEEQLEKLEEVMDARAETASDMLNMFILGARPEETVILCKPYPNLTDIGELSERLLEESLEFLMDLEMSDQDENNPNSPLKTLNYCLRALNECMRILKCLGVWCCYRIAKVFVQNLITLEVKEKLDDEKVRLLRYTSSQLTLISRLFITAFEDIQELTHFQDFISPKVKALVNELKKYKPTLEFTIEGVEPPSTNKKSPDIPDKATVGDAADDSEEEDGSDSSFTESDAEITDDETRTDMGGPLIKKRGQRRIRRNARKKPSSKQVKFAPNSVVTNPRLLYRGIALPPKVPHEGVSPPASSPRLCATVLVSSQFTAFALSRLLEELCFWDEELYFVKPGHLFALPTHNDKSGSASLNAKQEEVIRKFRFGEINVLLATRFIDSGLELPKCCLVVRFDPPDSFTSYLHSKGKGRITQSVFLHLVEEGEEEKTFRKQYERFCHVEKILVKRCESHNVFTDEDELDENVVDTLQPAYEPGGAKMTLSKSIDCLNRYCARLPSDAFTHLTPEWSIQEVKNDDDPSEPLILYRCLIKLPMNSPFKQIVRGDPMVNKTLSKMSAALYTIEKLHQSGELDDTLNPVGKTEVFPNLGLLIKEKLVEEVNDDGTSVDPMLVGSTKRRQYYCKRIAENLSNCLVLAGQVSYLYYIDLSLRAPLPDHHNIHGRPCYYPENEPRGFALLLNKPLEKIPKFPIYTRSGEESVDFLCLSDSLMLDQSQIDQLVKFHHILFQGVLRLEKDASMMFCQEHAYCQALVAPVTDKSVSQIDWPFISQVCESYCREENVCKVPPRCHKGKFEFREEDYINAVVMPSYRNFDQPQHYYVAEIRYDMSPLSIFPSEMYDTFEEYFNKKYNKKITNKLQPLLDADFTAIRLNLLSPRYVTHKGHPLPVASEEKKKARREDIHQKQLLLSEICFRHPFPSSVWRKAVCLPTIFYRLNYLLLAEELRRMIAVEAKVGLPHPPLTYEFTSLDQLLSPASYQQEEDAGSRSGVVSHRDDTPRYVDQKALQETQILEENEESHCGMKEIIDSSSSPDIPYDDDDTESVDSFEGDVHFCRPVTRESDASSSKDHLFEPSPSLILQCLTMSCSHDFVNLERLETVGDSFLKFAVTVHHYIIHKTAHEGKLSHLRSRQVCNMNLYRLGKAKGLGESLVGSKFEPYENWTPPGYFVKLDPNKVEVMKEIEEKTKIKGLPFDTSGRKRNSKESARFHYCVRNQQSLTDKSIADSVEALIGCYLTCRGHVTALRVMRWFGIDCMQNLEEPNCEDVFVNTDDDDDCFRHVWPLETVPDNSLSCPAVDDMLRGYEELEDIIQYKFRNRKYLLQSFTHASYHYNKSTDCYQRLEFLGDAVLDYVITRFLYEDSLKHSPGVLTDLRSALVNNNIFAALAVKWEFHRFFRCCSPELLAVIDRFVRYQKDFNKDNLDFISNENLETYDSSNCGATVQHTQVMDSPAHLQTVRFSSDNNSDNQKNDAIEIPKALGDIFESLAGAVFLDSNMSLDTVWRVFYRLMKERIDRYTACIPKSPVRELLEMEPDTANFEQPKRTGDGKIRVIVHIIGKGRFCAEGRNYRIAKSLAAKRALRALKELRQSTGD